MVSTAKICSVYKIFSFRFDSTFIHQPCIPSFFPLTIPITYPHSVCSGGLIFVTRFFPSTSFTIVVHCNFMPIRLTVSGRIPNWWTESGAVPVVPVVFTFTFCSCNLQFSIFGCQSFLSFLHFEKFCS